MTLERVRVWYSNKTSPVIEKALSILAEEIGRRSEVVVERMTSAPLCDTPAVIVTQEEYLPTLGVERPLHKAILSEIKALPEPGKEGYRIATLSGLHSPIVVSGVGERGVLYGLGKLLRKLEIRTESVFLPSALRLSSTPKATLRGHQLGYRPKTNAYDMWSKDHYRQYIRELALFGANAIELLPPRTDDEPYTDQMLYDQLEMMSWLSDEIHTLGLDVWIWYPNMSDDFSLPRTIEEESTERKKVFSSLPYINAVLMPGGDPGSLEPSTLFEWGRIQSEILKDYHPEAKLWISAQIFNATPAWEGAFFEELGKEPQWLGGVCHGPWVNADLTKFRASVPLRYEIRRYPDITHTLCCQYPVRDWDQAFAATLGRECYNPRPTDYKKIHNTFAEYAAGSICYSEGINDDANKFVWSDQDWDTNTPVEETLRDYARLFISPDYVEEITEGLLGLERNWRGPIASNPHIRATHSLWRTLEQRLPEEARNNYRLVMPLVRAHYDEYIRRRYHYEMGLEDQIVSIIEYLKPANCSESLNKIEALINKCKQKKEFDRLKHHCIELADRAFDLIRWQTSVVRHKGQSVVRGCFIDAIDDPITDVHFFAQAVNKAAKADSPAEKCSLLKEALQRCRPYSTGRFINLASVEDNTEVVMERRWEEDPSGLSIPYTMNVSAPWPSYSKRGELIGVPEEILPVVERSYVSSFFCKPIKIRLEKLSPRTAYRVRLCYVSHRRGGGIRFSAGGRLIHDFMIPENERVTMSFDLPVGCVAEDGVLELIWQAYPFRVYSEGIAWVIVEKKEARNV